MAKAKAKAKRGRPKGSKTNPPPITVKSLGRCRWCDSTALRVLTSTKHLYDGVDASTGLSYNLVRWQRCKCNSCDRVSIVKSFENQ